MPRQRQRQSIRLRTFISLLLVVTTAVTLVLVGSIILAYRIPQISSEAKDSVQRDAADKAKLLELTLSSLESQLKPLVALTLFSTPYDTAIATSLQVLVGKGEQFNAVYIVDTLGIVQNGRFSKANVAGSSFATGGDLSRNPLFLAAREGESVWSDKYLSAQSSSLVIGVAQRGGLWTVIGEIAPQYLRESVSTVAGRGDDQVLVVDRIGEYIADSKNEFSPTDNLGDLPIVKAMLVGQESGQEIEHHAGAVFAGAAKPDKLGWTFIVTRPAGWANPDIRKTVLLVVGGLCGSLLIGLLLAPLWAHSLSRPIQRLVDRTRQFAEGHYEKTEEVSSRIRELEVFGKDLQRMADLVHERETTLRESEEHYRAIYHASHDFISINRLSDWVLLDVNQPFLDVLGYERNEMVGHTSQELNVWVKPEDRQRFREILQRDSKCHDFETLFQTKSGKLIWVLASSTMVNIRGNACVYSIMRDITDRKQAEEEITALNANLEERVKRRTAELAARNAEYAQALDSLEAAQVRLADTNIVLQTVISTLPIRIFWKNNDSRYLGCNPLFAQDTSRQTPADVVGLYDFDLFPEQAELYRVDDRKVMDSDQPKLNFEEPQTVQDGKTIWLSTSKVPLKDATGNITGILGIYDDITARKQAQLDLINAKNETEKANADLSIALENLQHTQDELIRSEKLSSLGALVAGVSHELNTPIGNAVTLSSTLLDEQKRFSEKVKSGLTRLELQSFVDTVGEAGLILDRNLHRAAELIVNFKQLAVDQSSYQRRTFDLKEVVHEITLAMGPAIRRTPHTVHDEIPEGLSLDSFPGPLGQVLINLINNALIHAFGDRKSGNISIQARFIDQCWIEVAVCDDGRGISKEHQKRIFDPFFTTRLGHGGSGLGLHIVYGLVVDILGGRIDVTSKLGTGSTFRLRLPVSAPQSQTLAKQGIDG